MSVQIRINPVAANDLKEIKEYISLDNPEAASEIVREIILKIESLIDFPEMGSLITQKINLKSKYRYVICGQFQIFYVHEKGVISIQRILHGKRDIMTLLDDES